MSKIKACVFNAYGAVLDTYLPFEEYRDQLGENALVIYKLWRAKRLQYSSQLSLMNKFTSYGKITKSALDFACDVYGIEDDNIKNNILQAHANLAAYPDVKDALQTIKDKGIVTAVLSNGSPQKLATSLKHAEVDHLFNGIYSTEQIKAYKPSPAVYEFVEEQLALPRSKISFISSNSWDIAGAVAYGFYSVWINRYERKPERLPFMADIEINTLSDLASKF